jgi:hypothetical protein
MTYEQFKRKHPAERQVGARGVDSDYYTHPMLSKRAFDTREKAVKAAYREWENPAFRRMWKE